MDGKFGGFVIDLNETPLSSPRETILDDNDDVVIIERPPAPAVGLVEVGKRNGAAAAAGGGPSVVCVGCGDGFKGKIVGNTEEMKNWKCFKCLLRNGSGSTRGRGSGGGGGGGGRSVGLLDINASPPREAEVEVEGVHVGPGVDTAAALARRGGGDRSHGDKLQVIGHSSYSARPINLFSAFSNMLPPEKRYHLQKAPQIPADIGKSGTGDLVNHGGLSDTNSNRNSPGFTCEGILQGSHSTSTNYLPQSPNDIYLQSLREYVAEKKGVLGEGWRVEFEFCDKRLKTFAVYIAPKGSRFESISDVAEHLGLPSNSHLPQSENAENGLVPLQNGSHLYQRRKESSGDTKSSNSRPRSSIPKSSSLLSVNTCLDGLPLQFEDFYLITAGVIDSRPTYHNANQIWPVGYRSRWHDKVTGSLFLFEVRDGGDSGPVFMVQRYPCSTQSIPVGSTVLTRPKFSSWNGEGTAGKDDLATFGTIDDESVSIHMMLTESSPPHLDADTSSKKMGSQGLDAQKANLSSPDSFSQKSGDLVSNLLGDRDSIGEFNVEGRSISYVWDMVSETFLHACHEAYKQKGTIRFGCDHEYYRGQVKNLDNPDALSKYSHFAGPVVMPYLIQRDTEFDSTCQLIAKWLEQERFGLNEEFVQEIIEQLPGVSGCLEYKPLTKRKHHSTQQTVRSGFLQAKRKSDAQSQMESDSYYINLIRPGRLPKYSALRGQFPQGKPLCSKLPAYLIGDALQTWEFFWRFFEVLELQEAFTFQELEAELINPWLDVPNLSEKSGNVIRGAGDGSSRRESEVSRVRAYTGSYRCTGIVLSKIHSSLLKVLVGELLSKVAVYVDPKFDAGEPRSRRGRKKDAEYTALFMKMKLDMMPINSLTWPEIARRFILAVLSMEGNLDSAEIACRESGKVFHCLRGDGGTLCGSLTGVAALEADAVLLAEATRQIFGSLTAKGEAMCTDAYKSDAVGASKTVEMDTGEVPAWAQVLEPVRKLPTNVGARIRRCVNEALLRNPPEWAKKILEHSISKEVYKGNASGPTKRAVISVLDDVNREKPQQKPEKKEKMKTFNNMPDLIMKQCRIVLRRAAAADEDRVFCNLLGKTLLNPNDNDDEGLLGYPTMVSRPLDFRTIDLRLAAGVYGGSHEAFADDVREVWHNIHTAYKGQSDLIDLAETLSQQFEDLYEKEVLNLIQKTMVLAGIQPTSSESDNQRDEMLASVSESSLPKAPWEEGICKVCGMDKDDDNVLLCDSCDSEYHTYCLNPPLVRIPEGNWYCPSCIAGQSMSNSAPYGTQVVNRYGRRIHQRKYLHPILEMLAQLANTMELKDYWEFSVEERISLLKFLCDEALNSAIICDHIERSSTRFGDLQQKLRSLNSERKLLKFKEENLVANMAKTKGHVQGGSGESELNEMASLPADDGKFKAQLTNSSKVSPFGSLIKMEDGQQAKDQSDYSSTSMLEKQYPTVNTQVSKASLAVNQLRGQPSGIDLIQSSYIKGSKCKNELATSIQQKDDQSEDNGGTNIDESQELGCGSSSVSILSTGQLMPENKLSATSSEHAFVHMPSSPVHQCSTHANDGLSQECDAQLSNLKSEITRLQDSIDTLESELLRTSVRKEFLGRDADGRLYWGFGRPSACPQILVNASLKAEQVVEPKSFFHNFNSWMSYSAGTDVEELMNWLDDGDTRERELKEAILQWQGNKSMDSSHPDNDILDGGPVISNNISSAGKARDSDFLVTKAVSAMEKCFGPCLEIWTNDMHNNLQKSRSPDEGRMYRCECLELIWPSRNHCFSCHRTFPNSEELTEHAGEKCKTFSTLCPSSQISEQSSEHKNMLRNEKSAEKCSGSMSTSLTSLSEKYGNGSSFLDHSLEPECPFNFQEILSKFKVENSLTELVKEIGLIGSNGVVSFVPGKSPYLDDASLTLAPTTDNAIGLGDVPSVSESQQQQSDHGANTGVSANEISGYLQGSKLDKREGVGKPEFAKPMLLSQRGQSASTKERNSVLGIYKRCVIRESSLIPKVGKASEILRCLKINLLDMDAALPDASLRASRSHSNRRCAWRTFVKSAKSLYEMVQATIVLEDTIKTEYLRNDWWYWSSPSAAANISTLSALALRIYSLDSAILYEKPTLTHDPMETTLDCKSEKEALQSSGPTNNLKPSNQLMQKMPDSDSGENSKPRTRASKRRRDSGV
ncbi:methyl-CpG-binding domain-containing protein 9 isoform X1 [Coffea arabica]|uniref:Methyl-CpG-binding domain-containing protein 9 isoform X1 n=2 Tax=Coffea arabica TaxID=13443 RepID=A0A6P6V222_COFAR